MLDKTDLLAIVFEFLYPYRFILLYGGGGYLLFIGIFFSYKREEKKGMLKKFDTQILIHSAIAFFLTSMGAVLDFVGLHSQEIISFAFYYCNLLPTIIFVVAIWIVLHFTKRSSEKNRLMEQLLRNYHSLLFRRVKKKETSLDTIPILSIISANQ